MSLVIPDVGERNLLAAQLAGTPYVIALYKNDVVPGAGSVLADFVYSDFAGYTAAALTWGAVTTNANGKAQAVSNLYTGTFTGGAPQTVYGYVVTDNSGTKLLFAERAPTPISLATAGDTAKIQVTFTYESLY